MVTAEAAQYDAFVVGESGGVKGLYRFYIDSAGVLTMQTITEISRKVSAQIDEMETDEDEILLEISSPGADKPLTDIRQFGKHTGRNFEIETADEEFTGKLLEVNGNLLLFESEEIRRDGKKKIKEMVQRSVPFENIKQAIIKISFK